MRDHGNYLRRGEKHVAFSVSGGCFFYQMGIAYFIQKHFDLSDVKFSGASGGCWPATLLAADIDVKEALEVVLKFAPMCVERRPWKVLGAYGVYDQGIAIAFHELCKNKHPDLPSVVNGRLAMSVTRLAWRELALGMSAPFFKDEVVSEFFSNEDIVQCIVASALIPFALNGRPFVRYRDWICADGGITNVSGVRRFAAELAHDMELLEEGLDGLLEGGLERAHRLSMSYLLPPQLVPAGSSEHPKLGLDLIVAGAEEAGGDLHHAAPLSAGPYGAVRIPVDVARKVSQGLLHGCAAVASSGAQAVSSRLQAGASALTSCALHVATVPQSALAASGFTWDWVSGLASTASTSAAPSPRSTSTSPASERQEMGLAGYPSWPVPGLMQAESEVEEEEEVEEEDVVEEEGHSSRTILTPLAKDASSSTALLLPPPRVDAHAVARLGREDGVVREDGTYWRVQSPLVSKIPHGGLQLEISPWMWRHQPLLNYHLSSDPAACRRLFEMGMVDAAEHHFDLMKFFSPDDFVTLMK